MSNFKIITDLPKFELLPEINNLINNNVINWGNDNQICINTLPDKEEDFRVGCGSLLYDWGNKTTIIENGVEKLIVNKLENPRKEEDFSVFCSVFYGTVFEELYQVLTSKYKVGRIRLMKSKQKTCLSWHVDTTPRIHYPVKTQEGCFMVIDNEVMHLSQNNWWWTNTVLPHTAFNASKEERIHLVAVVLDEK